MTRLFRMGPRKWLAWKLVGLAYRLHPSEWVESFEIQPPTGNPISIHIVGDDYGCGVTSLAGLQWEFADGLSTAVRDGWTFTWRDPIPMTEWLNSET